MLKSKVLLLILSTFLTTISFGQFTTKMYIFGHSLLDHRPPLIATPSDETTIPHWLFLLSQHENQTYAASGQYGFLPQHDDLPPFSQWGYDIVPPAWESDLESFGEADFNKILITAGNFMQWQGPLEAYPGGDGSSPFSSTQTILDWLVNQEDSLNIYLYENWPDMAPFLNNNPFPPSPQQFANYNAYTNAEFHDWWIEYQDLLLAARPDINVRMIPVGPILTRLYQEGIISSIPVTELYEDDAPHGRANTYFLASLITYMAINNQKAATDFDVPSLINPLIKTQYSDIVNFIWEELNDFNDSNGTSRVFHQKETLPTSTTDDTSPQLKIFPNPVQHTLYLREVPKSTQSISLYNSLGQLLLEYKFQNFYNSNSDFEIPVSTLHRGFHFVQVKTSTGSYTKKILLN